jgi:hypothetical protein
MRTSSPDLQKEAASKARDEGATLRSRLHHLPGPDPDSTAPPRWLHPRRPTNIVCPSIPRHSSKERMQPWPLRRRSLRRTCEIQPDCELDDGRGTQRSTTHPLRAPGVVVPIPMARSAGYLEPRQAAAPLLRLTVQRKDPARSLRECSCARECNGSRRR